MHVKPNWTALALLAMTFASNAYAAENPGKALDAPIAPLIDPRLDAMLKSDGYNTNVITVRQLLSHSAELYDLGGTRASLRYQGATGLCLDARGPHQAADRLC